MTIVELKSNLILNKLPNLLIFTGSETGVMNIYIKQILDKLKIQVVKSESIKDVISLCSGNSFFKSKKIFIVNDDLEFLKAEDAWSNIKTILNNNILILRYHIFDSRLSFWKHFEAETVIFEPMHPDILSKHLATEFGLDKENCLFIVNNCGNDYIKCQLEINKLVNLAKVKGINIDTAFKRYYKEVLCINNNADLFEFIDAVLTKNKEKILILYRDLKKSNEPIVKIVSLLYNNFKNVLIAQTISNARNIQQNTGLNYYMYQKAKEFVGYYGDSEIEYILYMLMQIEQGIKTGSIDSEVAIDYFLLNL